MYKKRNLTSGSVAKNLCLFSLPVIMMNLLQAVYNVADMAITGQYAGVPAMAAISTSGQITNIILMLIIGFSNGITIAVGQLFGIGKKDEIKSVLGTMISVYTLLAVLIIAIIGMFGGWLLKWLKVPQQAFSSAQYFLYISRK